MKRGQRLIAAAAGLFLGGKRPTVMLQSSGLGNSINGLTSLFVPYQIPALIVISMRGDEDETEWNPAQIPMGKAVAPILDAIRIPHETVSSPEETAAIVEHAGNTAFVSQQAHACLLPRRITVPRN